MIAQVVATRASRGHLRRTVMAIVATATPATSAQFNDGMSVREARAVYAKAVTITSATAISASVRTGRPANQRPRIML